MSGYPSPLSMQQDGPDFYNLFIRMSCLTVPTNLKEIVRYLRFFRDQDGYDQYLKHYLPMLPAEYAAEFIEKEIEPEVTTFEVPVEEEKPKVKKPRKSKLSPPSHE